MEQHVGVFPNVPTYAHLETALMPTKAHLERLLRLRLFIITPVQVGSSLHVQS